MDERDPGADTSMFQAYAQRGDDPSTAAVQAVEAQQKRSQTIKVAIVVVLVLVVLGLILALV